jgi:hypothetical protein
MAIKTYFDVEYADPSQPNTRKLSLVSNPGIDHATPLPLLLSCKEVDSVLLSAVVIIHLAN